MIFRKQHRFGRALLLAALTQAAACKSEGPGATPTGAAPSSSVQSATGASSKGAASSAGALPADGGTATDGGAGGPSLSPTIPADVSPPINQQSVNEFSWQMFVAMNWPAAASPRGAPDTTKTIGQPGIPVWLTYKTPEEVFVAPGATPGDWNSVPQLPPSCGTGESARHVLAMDSKASDFLESTQQAVGGTVTDQHGKLARYEIHFNQTSFNYIVNNKLYDYATQKAATSVSFPPGTIEVKAAWREMTDKDDEATRKRFYRTTACICQQEPTGARAAEQCAPDREVGLVALHIIQRTPGAQQWIWATFEHVDNVASSAVHPSFNDPACPPEKCVPNKSTEDKGKPTGKPTQVTRLAPLPKDVQEINARWQARLGGAAQGSPWQYYELVNTQWPADPDDPTAPLGNPQPNILANTILETYIQPDSSCMGCHYTATTVNPKVKSDFSFVFLHTIPPAAPGAKK